MVNIGGGAYSGLDKNNPDTITYNIALWNRIPQPIGTTDGTTSDSSRVVITSYIVGGTGTATLDNADGTATFVDSASSATPVTYASRQYMDYPGLLAQNDTSPSEFFRFVFSPTVTSLKWRYLIWTRVQYQYGYVTVSPSSPPVLAPGQNSQFSGVVLNQLGKPLPDAITWSSSNAGIATVNSTGQVTAVAAGTATITATSTVNAQRIGTRTIIVDKAPEVTGTTPADGATSVASNSNIVITFSEPVIVSTNSFLLECPVSYDEPRPLTVSGSGTSTITIDPVVNLPEETCTVTVQASVVSDVDTYDGPDVMALDSAFSFHVGTMSER
jgi:hypothetical protein